MLLVYFALAFPWAILQSCVEPPDHLRSPGKMYPRTPSYLKDFAASALADAGVLCAVLGAGKSFVKVAITGASGFIGRALADSLRSGGHTVTAVSLRTSSRSESFPACEAVVHLAGEPVAQRWTRAARERIRSSRVEGTRVLVDRL